MRKGMVWALAVAAALGWAAVGEGASSSYYSRYTKKLGQLTIAELRELGLSDDQLQKVCETRRDLGRQVKKLEAQRDAARAAVRAANAEANRIAAEITRLTGDDLDAAIKAVMTPEQRTRWAERHLLDQAKRWLKSYSYSLNLTEAQNEDIAQLLVPVLKEQEAGRARLAEARASLETLREADKIDVKAIDQAEKSLAELEKQSPPRGHYKPLLEAMRAGLLPDQLEKFDKRYRHYLQQK